MIACRMSHIGTNTVGTNDHGACCIASEPGRGIAVKASPPRTSKRTAGLVEQLQAEGRWSPVRHTRRSINGGEGVRNSALEATEGQAATGAGGNAGGSRRGPPKYPTTQSRVGFVNLNWKRPNAQKVFFRTQMAVSIFPARSEETSVARLGNGRD
jgi:hypothetical protein